jgi:hypothetical protein
LPTEINKEELEEMIPKIDTLNSKSDFYTYKNCLSSCIFNYTNFIALYSQDYLPRKYPTVYSLLRNLAILIIQIRDDLYDYTKHHHKLN